MFLEAAYNRTTAPLLEKVAAFTEARHQMLADNVANFDTPEYQTRRLSLAAFQSKLREAVDRRKSDPAGRLAIEPSEEFAVGRDGRLRVSPTTEGRENILFHDGTSRSVEAEMSEVAKNALLHRMCMYLLKGSYDGMMKAIKQKA